MAATASEAFMLELVQQGCEWIKSEQYQKRLIREEKERQKNNPMKQCVLKYDHFENIHRLSRDARTFEGAPNFRQVPGYVVFGTGQPTKEGFQSALNFLRDELKVEKVLWCNMRQEPVVYMNSQSFTPRLADRMNENMEFPEMSGDDIEWLQNEFIKVIRERIEATIGDRKIKKEEQGKVSYFRDTYAEHPEDRENIEYRVHLKSDDALTTLSGLYDQMRALGYELSYCRFPIVDEKAPREKDFDDMKDVLRAQSKDTACVFNCQMGKGRTTTGMILATLMKDVLFGDPNKQYPQAKEVLEKDFSDEDEYLEEKARLGQFEVVSNIFQYIPEAKEGKAHIDHVIDLCGVPPTGTGLQNLRECIIWTKQKFDFEPKKKRPFWQRMAVNFIERYCYLICFATYVREQAQRDFEWSFVNWMDQRAEIREVIYRGMKDFQWK